MIKLSERIHLSRADRPDEWSMDDYSREAKKLEDKAAELEKALRLTNGELSKTIDEVNNDLKFNICSSDLDDPDYWDKETCHNNSLLLKEQTND